MFPLLCLCASATTHGGTGCGSTRKLFRSSRADFSCPSSTISPGAYFRYHPKQLGVGHDATTAPQPLIEDLPRPVK